LDFKVDDVPAIRPTEELEENGCEDARATLIDGGWFITYTAVSRFGITPCLAYTTDFRRYEKRGPILGPDNKDIALFPELRDGAFTALTRPMPSVFGHVLGIWIVYPDPRRPWGGPQPLVMPRRGYWDERHTGASTIPILTSHGWLEIYHGVDAELRYSLGGVLLDRDDPTIVLARSAEPILRPKMDYERNGLFANTIYACGHVPLDERGERIRVYYGAADSVIAAADFTVDEVIESLEPTPAARH
jgi:predicted GH43/DUF377 family glycosyl hydrolase